MPTPVSKLQIIYIPIERLIPYARNARQHSEEQIAQIAASLREFGFNNPILIDADDGIVAGHGRALAALKLGLTEVPVVILGHLTSNQRRAYMLADNKLALNASWDPEMLRLEVEALAEEDVDLTLLGFSEEELKDILIEELPVGKCDEDDAPALAEISITAPGDLWILGDARVLCGDGTRRVDVDRVLNGRSADMVFADLPYNANYSGKTSRKLQMSNDNLGENFTEFLEAACRTILAVTRGAVYICMSSSELHRLHAAFLKAGGHWSTFLIWTKNTFTLGRSDYQRQYEPLLYGWPEGRKHHWCGDRNQGDVWEFAKPVRNDLHPTMKPVELVERAINNSSVRGDVVLDPFAGGGSTLIACTNLDRNACCVEIDPRYVDVIVKRWQKYTGKGARLDGDGRTFDAIAEAGREPVTEASTQNE